jgi:hypothetical protein
MHAEFILEPLPESSGASGDFGKPSEEALYQMHEQAPSRHSGPTTQANWARWCDRHARKPKPSGR